MPTQPVPDEPVAAPDPPPAHGPDHHHHHDAAAHHDGHGCCCCCCCGHANPIPAPTPGSLPDPGTDTGPIEAPEPMTGPTHTSDPLPPPMMGDAVINGMFTEQVDPGTPVGRLLGETLGQNVQPFSEEPPAGPGTDLQPLAPPANGDSGSADSHAACGCLVPWIVAIEIDAGGPVGSGARSRVYRIANHFGNNVSATHPHGQSHADLVVEGLDPADFAAFIEILSQAAQLRQEIEKVEAEWQRLFDQRGTIWAALRGRRNTPSAEEQRLERTLARLNRRYMELEQAFRRGGFDRLQVSGFATTSKGPDGNQQTEVSGRGLGSAIRAFQHTFRTPTGEGGLESALSPLEIALFCGQSAIRIALRGSTTAVSSRIAATQELAEEIMRAGGMGHRQTITLLETAEGRIIVAAGRVDLTPAQKILARRKGLLVAADMPGFHAEITAMWTAGARGLLPTRGVITNIMCRDGAGSCFRQLADMAARGGYRMRLSADGRCFDFIRIGGP